MTKNAGKKQTSFRNWMMLFNDGAVIGLIVLFVVGTGAMGWYVTRLQANLVESMALTHAGLYSEVIAEFRTLYTRDIVERVRRQGIEITHDFENKKDAIPLPATLSMELGRNIGKHQSGTETRLYSAYPFPWRKDEGGLQDEFAQEAWVFLQKNPSESFIRFEEVKGRQSIRFASADIMRKSCLNCHNTHPDTPKNDWKENDVRGILEIIYPLDKVIAEAKTGSVDSLWILSLLAVLSLGGLVVVVVKLRKIPMELEYHVAKQTDEISKTNQEMENQILDRKQVHEKMIQSQAAQLNIMRAMEATQRDLKQEVETRKRAEEAVRILNEELGQKVDARTKELTISNQEMEAFSYSVSHDLRTPLRGIDGISQVLLDDYGDNLDDQGRDLLDRIRTGAQRMANIMDDLMHLFRISSKTLSREEFNLSKMVDEISKELKDGDPDRTVDFQIQKGLKINGDRVLMKFAMNHLLDNAWKFSQKTVNAVIEVGVQKIKGKQTYFVKDNGIGFDMEYESKLFGAFQRLHSLNEFSGSGIGLANVQRIINRHGGNIWADGEVGKGATLFFNLKSQDEISITNKQGGSS